MLTMPEALLLFALHDQKGTVQASAFLAIDHALRGALLAELRLRGYLQTRATGDLRVHPNAPADPSEAPLMAAWGVLRESPHSTTDEALSALQRRLGDVRELVAGELGRRGIVARTHVERVGLPDDIALPMANGSIEAELRRQVIAGVAAGEAVGPRVGTMIALSVAAHLEADLFEDLASARRCADWVAERDAVVRSVREAVQRVEGW